MKSFQKLSLIQFKLFWREPIAMFFTLAFPLLMLVLFGIIFGNDPSPNYGGTFGYIDAMVPGLVAVVVGSLALIGLPTATAAVREQKTLRRLKAAPMNPLSYLAADITVYFLVTLAAMVLLIIAAELIFGLRFGGNWLNIFLAFTLSTLSFMAAGYVLASLSPTSRFAQVAGQVIFLPMMFVSGVTLPLEIMPERLQQVSRALPMTQMVTLLQDLWFGKGWNWTAVAVLVALLLLGTLISARTFRWE